MLESEIPETPDLDDQGEPTGTTSPATEDELLQRDMIVVADLPAGETVRLEDTTDYTLPEDGYLVLCAASKRERWEKFPGDRVVSSGFLGERNNIKANLRERAHTAVVYRATDGRVNLRKKIKGDLGLDKGVGPRVPADGSHSAQPEKPEQAQQVLQEAKRRAAPPDDSEPTARKLEVPMRDVEDGDVVARDQIWPRISGDRTRGIDR